MRWEDDSDPGDRGRKPEDEPAYTFGLASMLSSATIVAVIGGFLLIAWGIVWLTIGQWLGVAVLLLGVVVLAALWWQFRERRRARRPRPR
jgi:Flp pilus assembly protein TadB